MSTYLVGDLQGCYQELDTLLGTVGFSRQHDTLWLCGDLVARGPDSLSCLRLIKSLGHSAKTVLGNHDLHLLATAAGFKTAKPRDKVQAILDAPDRIELLDWLSQQALLAEHDEFVVTHAGIPPMWDLNQARQQAQHVERVLRSERQPWLLQHMYGNQPAHWENAKTEIEQLRFTINALTRMRFCYSNGSLDSECKFSPHDLPVDSPLMPWFQLPRRKSLTKPIIFGHWAALNGKFTPPEYGLDTGCVWGGTMTMLRWEDKQQFVQKSYIQ
ncbi:bis(5'-nucleosyl)-tetraphosphatase (symmetrical) ApaH [Thaumasiovibrio sp. DFM-14]|uniref:bis(5'-nucleosyl)-tetraphosphatase (symmetrical) ApaH n=1 Tax=Thaumasiovibrio sp. DFM-14 TaxID=3384792 RepID=UPI0039A21445